jgi:hypothetical protein
MVCVLLARRREGGQAVALLGGAAGISFAGVAALVKVATDTFIHGIGGIDRPASYDVVSDPRRGSPSAGPVQP